MRDPRLNRLAPGFARAEQPAPPRQFPGFSKLQTGDASDHAEHYLRGLTSTLRRKNSEAKIEDLRRELENQKIKLDIALSRRSIFARQMRSFRLA